jgi:uncharacterized membrane protein
MARTRQWTDQQVEITISILLRVGVTLAAATVIVGGIFYLIHNGHDIPEDHIFRGEPADLRQVPWQQRDQFYIIVTLIVLAILIHGLLSTS